MIDTGCVVTGRTGALVSVLRETPSWISSLGRGALAERCIQRPTPGFCACFFFSRIFSFFLLLLLKSRSANKATQTYSSKLQTGSVSLGVLYPVWEHSSAPMLRLSRLKDDARSLHGNHRTNINTAYVTHRKNCTISPRLLAHLAARLPCRRRVKHGMRERKKADRVKNAAFTLMWAVPAGCGVVQVGRKNPARRTSRRVSWCGVVYVSLLNAPISRASRGSILGIFQYY